jgi:hypothetical protein
VETLCPRIWKGRDLSRPWAKNKYKQLDFFYKPTAVTQSPPEGPLPKLGGLPVRAHVSRMIASDAVLIGDPIVEAIQLVDYF